MTPKAQIGFSAMLQQYARDLASIAPSERVQKLAELNKTATMYLDDPSIWVRAASDKIEDDQ